LLTGWRTDSAENVVLLLGSLGEQVLIDGTR
jgi:hypothetical protein